MSEYSIADAIKQFLNKSRYKSSIQALQIEEAWELIMGKTIAKYTNKIEIFGNTLIFIQMSLPSSRNYFIKKKRSLNE